MKHRVLPMLGALALAACATTSDPPRRMMELNRKAVDAYTGGELDRARRLLLEAVLLGKEAGLQTHPALARTYLHLGAVYLARKDRTRGMRHLGLALRVQPDIQVTPELRTPPLERALASAAKRLGQRRPPAAARAKEKALPPKREAPPPKETVVAAAAPPASLPQPLYCPTPGEAPSSTDLAMKCAARAGLPVSRVVLYYRSPGNETFTVLPMTRSRQGWYEATVPATATTGRSLQYYVEAQGPARKVTTSNGNYGSPNLLVLRGEDDEPPPGGGEARDDDPLLELEREREQTAREASIHRRPAGRPWVGLGVGTGWGWQPGRTGEASGVAIGAGFLGGGLLHLAPELGWQLSDRWALSVQGRHQFVVGRDSAHAALARLWLFAGGGNAQAFVNGSVGYGQGFRLVAEPDGPLVRKDTVRGGPLLLGPGAGLMYHFARGFALGVEARALVGAPDFAVVGEVATVMQVGS